MSEKQPFAMWALVEVMGHNQFVGYVTEETVADVQFVRVDVPETSNGPAFTKLIGPSSIYAISPLSEEVARRAAEHFRRAPMQPWQLPEIKSLAVCNDDED